MNCAEVREQFFDVPDGGDTAIREHVAGCSECRQALIEFRATLAAVTPGAKVRASSDFKERVMREIATLDAAAARRRFRFGAPFPKIAWTIAAAVLLIIGVPVVTTYMTTGNGAITLLADSVQAMANLRSVHLTGRMRTLPADNFELIGTKYGFVPVEMWKDFSNPPRWRVEKSGRVVVMDGQSSVMLIGNRMAVRAGKDSGMVQWLKPLLDADKVLDQELAAVRKGQARATVSEASGAIVLTVARKAEGDFTNDWARNKSIAESDHACVYRFDAATKRLTGLQVVVGDIVVFEITGVEYDRRLADSLFTLPLPENVTWYVPPEQMPAGRAPAPANAKEAAMVFFEALAREDWAAVGTVWPQDRLPDSVKNYLGGLQVVSLGDAFQSGRYPGWFVPYEIRLRNGETKKHNLAVRNDNPGSRWTVDGGI